MVRLPFSSLTASILVFSLSIFAYAEEGTAIPVEIHTHLETNYPGWKLTPINKKLIAPWNQGAYSNFLEADINGDKAMDYALCHTSVSMPILRKHH